MRKRKSPIVLLTTLVVIVAAVSGLQFAWSRTTAPGAPAPQAAPVEDVKPIGDKRPSESSQSVAGSVKSLMGQKAQTHAATDEPGPPPGAPGADNGPLVLNPEHPSGKSPKPKPNSSSTAAQWYNDESALSKQKG